MDDATKLRLLNAPAAITRADHGLAESLVKERLLLETKRPPSKRRGERYMAPVGPRAWKVTPAGTRELEKLRAD